MNRLLLLFLVFASIGCAENFTFENQTIYPSNKSKMAVQWASSVQEVQERNQALIQGQKLNELQFIKGTGEINLTIPKKARYFRILVWSKGEKEPDLHTNWVEIVPSKTYTLTTDLLVPSVLMSGTGC
jgi:hypothetical protein